MKRFSLIIIICCLALLASSANASASVRYVNRAAAAGGNGTSWNNAFTNIQAGLNAAVAGDEVWVAAGTYVENITLKDGVALYGGFIGTETVRNQRNWVNNLSIIDGNRAGSVVTAPSGLTNTARIDGFTIRNGWSFQGGGINCAGSPYIINNVIRGNGATQYLIPGGGIYCTGSPIIKDNLIIGNFSNQMSIYALGYGITVWVGSSALIVNNTICGNGQGIYLAESGTVKNNIIAFNNEGIHGNAFQYYAVIENNCVYNNYDNFIDESFYDYQPPSSNILIDPQFVDQANGNYNTQLGSPCRDAGVDSAITDVTDDLNGNSRIFGTHVDLGAYEWNNGAHVLTYDGNGATSGSIPIDSGHYGIGDPITVAANSGALAKTGLVFSGWNTRPDGSGANYPAGTGIFHMGGTDVILYARWLSNYTVSFDSQGGSQISPIIILSGSTISPPTAPTQTGYTFAGWYQDRWMIQAFDFNTPIMADITLYAGWIINSYAVTYDGNGNTSGSVPTDGSHNYNTNVTVLGNTGNLARTGYTFAGWNTQTDGSGTNYTAGDAFIMEAFDVTLYAKWTVNSYTVTYNGNGNTSGTVPTDVNHNYNTTVTVLGNTGNLARTGYTFAGWNTQANGSGTTYTDGNNFTMGAANVTLYAKWIINSYTVTYDGNGNTSGTVPTDFNHNYNTTVTVLGNTGNLARTGHTFAGWNTQADGNGTTYSTGNTFIMGTANVTLYAKWIISSYTVTYNGNGNTSGTVPTDVSHTYNTSVTVLSNTGNLARTGYTFAGWNTQADGSGTTYTAGNTFTMGGANVTLYAKWNTNSYTVTYDGNGNTDGTAPTDVSHKYNTSVTVLSSGTLVKTGCSFTGWNTKADGGGTTYTPGNTFTMGAANDILYAQWNKVAAPSFSLTSPGPYNTVQSVSIYCENNGAAIHYSTDGSDPTQSSPLYNGTPVLINTFGSTTLKARAFVTGMSASAITSQTYTINGTITRFQPGGSDPANSPNQLLTALNFEGDLAVQYNTALLRLSKGTTGKLSGIWLYFPRLIGSNSGQIPTNAKIVSAQLVLTVKCFTGNAYQSHKINLYQITDPDGKGDPHFGTDGLRNGLDYQYRDHRSGMNIPWKTGAANIGVLLNGSTPVDTYEAIPNVFTAEGYTQIRLDVTTSIKDWLNGDPTKSNQGWFLGGDQANDWGYGDGIEFYGVGDATAANRPKLEVTYLSTGGDNTPPDPVTLWQDPVSGDRQTQLYWINPVNDFSGVIVLRKAGVIPSGPTDGTVVYTGQASTFLDNQGLTNDQVYYYSIFAYDNVWNYSRRFWLKAIPTAGGGAPNTPGNLSVGGTGNTLTFSWTDNSGNEKYYLLEQREGTSGAWLSVAYLAKDQQNFSTPFDNPNFGLKPGTLYNYRLSAVNDYGASGYAAASYTTTAFMQAPTGLTWQIISAGRVNLRWTDQAIGESGYRVEVYLNDSGHTLRWSINLPADATSCSVTGFNPGTEYLIKVVAVRGTNEEAAAWSNIIKTTTDFKGGLL